MNKYILIISLVAALSCPVGFCQIKPCPLSSRNVELYGFYGGKETIIENFTNLPMKLSERRVFLQITWSGRTDAKMNVTLFEQQKNGGFSVTEWSNVKAVGLFDEVDKAIIENKGKDCVGEAMKAVLAKRLGQGKPLATLAALASPKDAFSPSVQDASGDFVKSVVIFGC